MQRDDFVWLAIRLAGVFLIVRAILEIPVALGAFATYAALQSALSSTLGPDPELGRSLFRSLAASRGLSAPIAAALYLLLGAWFVRGAPALTRALLREDSDDPGPA